LASLPQSDPIAELLKRSKTIAVVGLSCNPLRASHGVSAYMRTQGYRIIPVNPQIEECLGEKAYPSLLDVPDKIDIVNIFRRNEFVEEIVDQAIQLKVPAIWMQEDVIHERAAEKARKAGIYGPQLPREYGGLGLGTVAMCVVFEQAGRSFLGPLALNAGPFTLGGFLVPCETFSGKH